MKKYLAIICSIIFFTSCDKVEGPYMSDTNIEPIDTTYIKKILIEDFTGHLCPNCPDAAREIEAIHDIYGDQIIGMAIHASTAFAKPYNISQAPSFQYDFRTQWGDDWDDIYGMSQAGLPRGMVNRIGYPNNHKLGKDEWASIVAQELSKQSNFKISINTTINSISLNSKVSSSISGDYNIMVCLTESNIINWQKDGGSNVEDYQHNHVLRSVLIDEPLSNLTSYVSGQEIETMINYDLASLEQFNIDYSSNTAVLGNGNAGDWNSDNISIIAYIYNVNTKEIMQVEESNLNN